MGVAEAQVYCTAFVYVGIVGVSRGLHQKKWVVLF